MSINFGETSETSKRELDGKETYSEKYQTFKKALNAKGYLTSGNTPETSGKALDERKPIQEF